jgi:4,5-dihydroxyphthalate decarboxylase
VTNELELTLAIHDYDHTRDLVEGRVRAAGIRLRVVPLSPPEINARFSRHREWHVSEFGLGKYIAQRAGGDDSITAIPVFPMRAFRQSSIYVRTDGALAEARELAGRAIGIPEWAQTAVVYARGYLAHDAGLDLAGIDWHQAGVSRPGRVEKVNVTLPPGVRVTPHPDATLEQLLFDGTVDAIITAQPPDAFRDADPRIRRLFSDPRAVESDYFARTGIFPIMHTVAIRRDVYDEHPWIAINLLTAFEAAKRASYARMTDAMGCRYPLPWIAHAFEAAQATFGEDPYPYGLEANRTTLDAVLAFAHEQGVASRRLVPEDLFAAPTHASLPL